jgi:FtsH-binding integral membrane protein
MDASILSAPYSVAEAPANERAQFIRRTYLHLAGAIFAFTALCVLWFVTGVASWIAGMVFSMPFSWLIVMVAFMAVSWIADKMAQSDTSQNTQYLGLTIYVIAESIVFIPLLYIAAHFASPAVLPLAAGLTLLLFLGLTVAAFITQKDFSFLGPILCIGGFVALGVIVAGILFGFNLGLLFSGIMVLFAGGAILYTTSNIIHHYRPDQHVAASLALFAAVALLFWYVLRIVISLTSRR